MMGVLRVLIARLPRPAGYWLADRIGDVIYYIANKSRRAATSNLRHVMPTASDSKLRKAVHGVFHTVLRNYYDLCRAPDMSVEEIDRLTTYNERGWQRVLELHGQGRGVILVSAHFGSFDMVTQQINRHGISLTALIAQTRPAWLSDFVSQLRGARGVELLLVDEEEGGGLNLGALKRSVSLLREGGVLGVLADRNMEQRGATIEFFGHKTIVAAGVAKMALRTNSPVVVALCRRMSRGRYDIAFNEPIEPEGSASNQQDVEALLTRIFKQLEPLIRCNPDQWVLLQPVWPDR
jgi:phosphatidylinositol dimannoside acyltransferase